MKLDVKNLSGEVKDSIDVSDLIFGVPFNEALVHQVLVGHLANRRVGTHSTKTRSEVRGGGRKPWIQKHTGRARQGSIRSPQWRKGGITFGPKPRDYHHHTPVKMRRGAIRCLLAEKVRQGQITIVEELLLPQPKTKFVINLLNDLGAPPKSLVVSGQPSLDLQRGCRNLEKVKSLPAATINTVCSSSIVALDMGTQNLRLGKCSKAVVAGVNLMLGTGIFQAYGVALGPEGRCKTFDDSANGLGRGEACEVIYY